MVSFVATPIGNLKDITLRALETRKGADVIYCEDTRHTIKLLNAYEIKKPLYACHKFNETEAAEKILAASRRGENVAVVSDAGTPVVSDPGNVVCQILREANEPYTLIPGASAFVAALVLSALFQCTVQHREELRFIYRLHQIMQRSHFVTLRNIIRISGNKNNLHCFIIPTYLLGHGHTVHGTHFDIQQENVESFVFRIAKQKTFSGRKHLSLNHDLTLCCPVI